MEASERRKFAREQCLISAHLRVGTQIYEGTLINISEDGSYFSSRRFVEPGSTVQVRFRHPWTEEMVTARGVVMRLIRSGQDVGVGIAMLDTLSDLEEGVTTTSGAYPVPMKANADRLKMQALAAAKLKAASTPGARVLTPTPQPSPPLRQSDRQMRQARLAAPALKVRFSVSGRSDSIGTLTNVSPTGLQIRCGDPPEPNRLVRLDIVEGEGRAHLRIAGKVSWSSRIPTDDHPIGFGVRILHFLSAADEQRWGAFLDELRGVSTGSFARPG